jgi:hypothetical protein
MGFHISDGIRSAVRYMGPNLDLWHCYQKIYRRVVDMIEWSKWSERYFGSGKWGSDAAIDRESSVVVLISHRNSSYEIPHAFSLSSICSMSGNFGFNHCLPRRGHIFSERKIYAVNIFSKQWFFPFLLIANSGIWLFSRCSRPVPRDLSRLDVSLSVRHGQNLEPGSLYWVKQIFCLSKIWI